MSNGGRQALLLERERRRLRSVFGAALLAGAAAPAAQACTKATAGPDVDAAASDANPPSSGDAIARVDASSDAGDPGLGGGDASDIECGTVVDLDSPISDGPPEAQLCSVVLPCGWPPQLVASGCTLLWGSADGAPLGCFLFEQAGCGQDAYSPPESGAVTIACYCDNFTGGGRRPWSVRVVRRERAHDPLGAYLARMAAEEAASVHAFEQLSAELTRLGAPIELVVAAAFSARDEQRHSRTMTRLTRRRGAEPVLQSVGRRRSHDVEAIARHNAVEGCIRETYGALVAHWQAARAEDPALRVTFARIARDETRHAALAWAIARWVDTRLPPSGRRRVADARRRAVRALERELEREPHEDVVRHAGLPRAEEATALLRAMATRLDQAPRDTRLPNTTVVLS